MTDTAIKLTTPEFRGSYVNLIEPRAVSDDPGAEKKYSMLIVLSKTDPEAKAFVKKLEAAIQTASAEKHGKPIPKERLKHYPIKDGDNDEKEDFHGHWLISASNKFKPGAIDLNGQKLISTEDLYSGAWYRASISCWAWDNPKGGKGVSINLKNVLKVRDDDAFTGVAKAEDDFADFLSEKPSGSSTDDDLLG